MFAVQGRVVQLLIGAEEGEQRAVNRVEALRDEVTIQLVSP